MNIAQVEKVQISPNNQPSNNTYSFKGGNPIITIQIASANKLLKASSVRLNGKLKVLQATGDTPNNQNAKGTGAKNVQLNDKVGVSGMIQNIVLSSEQTGQTLESIRQYGRLVASLVPSLNSQETFINEHGISSLAMGIDAPSSLLVNNQVSFSIPLYAGMLQSGVSIPLGSNGVRGLNIQIELAADQMALTGADAATGLGASYEISDVTLTADLLVPDAAGQQALSVPGTGAFSYNSFNSLYSVINSSDSTQQYNLANSNVLSVIHNFLPVPHANNYANDSFATNMLLNKDSNTGAYGEKVVLDKVSFTRGGVKLALDYELDTQVASEESRPETGVMVNFLNAFRPLYNLFNMTNNNQGIGFGGNQLAVYSREPQKLTSVDKGRRNFGIGIACDNVSRVGVSFRGQNYATRIQSSLNTQNAVNSGVVDVSPNAIYTYVLARNTLQYSPQGIMVVN
jgi:hypothetical protein